MGEVEFGVQGFGGSICQWGFVILGLAEGALKICEITSFDIERFSLTRKTQFNYEDLTN